MLVDAVLVSHLGTLYTVNGADESAQVDAQDAALTVRGGGQAAVELSTAFLSSIAFAWLEALGSFPAQPSEAVGGQAYVVKAVFEAVVEMLFRS